MTDAFRPRWRGQPGRLEVWYASATDRRTGTGLWIHHELVAPSSGSAGRPFGHGWIAVFPPGEAAKVARFDAEPPVRHDPRDAGSDWFRTAAAGIGPGIVQGAVADGFWDLRWLSRERPLWTFPARVWEREFLPAAQVVAAPKAGFHGPVSVGGHTLDFDGVGNVAHIYGHGNAQRWAWLHADLDDMTTLEIVAAVARRPGLNRLSPLVLLQLRRSGHLDWPAHSLLAAPAFRARIGLPSWRVTGWWGRQRIRVEVHQPERSTLAMDYADPDGARAICHNCETADVEVTLERWSSGWQAEQAWRLVGAAHAELGTRP